MKGVTLIFIVIRDTYTLSNQAQNVDNSPTSYDETVAPTKSDSSEQAGARDLRSHRPNRNKRETDKLTE